MSVTGRQGSTSPQISGGAEAPVDLSGVGAARSVLRIRPFRRLWGVLSVAAVADWVGILATAVFATTLVEPSWAKGVAFGGVIGIRLLPALVLGTVAGVIADRFDRRYTLLVSDLLRFLLFASIPVAFLGGLPQLIVLGWMAIAIFLIEAITLVWNPAKDAAVPNLVPRARLETANQLSLIATYGVAPVLAALLLAGMEPLASPIDARMEWEAGTLATLVALSLNALSRLATALVVFFGIREISGRAGTAAAVTEQPTLLRQFYEGWKYIGQTRLVRGLVLGILGAFAAGGIVVGTAQFYAASLGGGNATFYLLFGLIFIGLGSGIALGPWAIGQLSRRRWFGINIMLAAIGVIVLAVAVHLSIAVVGALLVGAGAGMALLSGMTLLGGEVTDDVRGRVFAFVHTSVRAVLMLAIAVTGPLAGAGGSRVIDLGVVSVPVSYPRLLLLAAGVFGILAGQVAFRQMDDKPGCRCWPTCGGRCGDGRCRCRSRWHGPAVRGVRRRGGRGEVDPGRPPGSGPAGAGPPGGGQPGTGRHRVRRPDPRHAAGRGQWTGRADPPRRGAAVRGGPGAPRRHRDPAGARPGRRGDQRPVRGFVRGLPGRRA